MAQHHPQYLQTHFHLVNTEQQYYFKELKIYFPTALFLDKLSSNDSKPTHSLEQGKTGVSHYAQRNWHIIVEGENVALLTGRTVTGKGSYVLMNQSFHLYNLGKIWLCRTPVIKRTILQGKERNLLNKKMPFIIVAFAANLSRLHSS